MPQCPSMVAFQLGCMPEKWFPHETLGKDNELGMQLLVVAINQEQIYKQVRVREKKNQKLNKFTSTS